MTISYSYEISTSKFFTFLRVLFRWRASIWKSALRELAVWTAFYYVVFFVYRYCLSEENEKWFEHFIAYCDARLEHKYIPLDFLLGFFVKIVVDRWSKIFANIGFVDNVAHMIGTLIRGSDLETKTMRRNLVRYLCLTQVLILRDISMQVRKRFPNLDSVVEAGFLLPHEKEKMEGYGNNSEEFGKYWMPMNWVFEGCYRMRELGKITADSLLDGLLTELRSYRHKLQNVCEYDWVPIPLAYTQTVFLAVRVYFFICLVARQHVIKDHTLLEGGHEHKEKINIYVPFLTMLQLFIYIGWVKVAEALINPLGEDDDDFECNFIIDRNIAIAMAIADECHNDLPEQKPDNFPESGEAIVPLYSEEASLLPQNPLIGSAHRRKPDETTEHVHMVRKNDSVYNKKPSSIARRITSPLVDFRNSLKRFARSSRISEEDEATQTSQRNSVPQHSDLQKKSREEQKIGLTDLKNKTVVKIFDSK